jgi:hypothetical protein
MSSDINNSLEEINRKLQLLVEKSFLSRLDLIFSVLLSLTIFLVSLMLNNAWLHRGLFAVFWISMLALFIYTLIGEFYAIIRDDVVGRFKFWMTLPFNFMTLSFLLSVFTTLLILPVLMLFLGFIGLVWLVGILLLLHYTDNLFHRYIRLFPSRFRYIPVKEWGKLLFPTLAGHMVLTISFFIAYYFLVIRV